jgi:hypothetical protein
MNTPRPELHDTIPDVVARERDPRTGRVTRLGNGDRRGKRDSNPSVSVRPAKQNKKVLVGAGVAIFVLLLAGVAVATTTGGASNESTEDDNERRSAASTLPGGSSGGGGLGAQLVVASTVSMIPTTVENKRYNGMPVTFECTPSACEPQIFGGLAGTGFLPMKQSGDRFVGERSNPAGTGGWTCSSVIKADLRVLDWQDVEGIRVPARVSLLATAAVDGGYLCDEYDAVFEGSSDVDVDLVG